MNNEKQLTLGFYDDKQLRAMPETDVIAALIGKLPRHNDEIMPQAVSFITLAIKSSAQIGQLIEEIHNRHKGSSWVEVFARVSKELEAHGIAITQSTADRFRQQWLNRDRVIFTEHQSALAITNAYRHAELLPQPEPSVKPDLPPPPFKLTFTISDKPVDQWGREYVVDFLQRTEKVEKLRIEAKAFIAQGA